MCSNTALLLIYIKLIAHGVSGALPLPAVKLVEEENSCKQELLQGTRKTTDRHVLEKMYEKQTAIQWPVLKLTASGVVGAIQLHASLLTA